MTKLLIDLLSRASSSQPPAATFPTNQEQMHITQTS
jgi:hypothetical protein